MDWVAPLLALTAMEVVLGIDNVVFLSVTAARLPPAQQPFARRLGLGLALGLRIALLFAIGFLMRLSTPLFRLDALGIPAAWLNDHVNAVTARDLILFAGGAFLLWKSVREIHHLVDPEDSVALKPRPVASLPAVVGQIAFLDLIFSLDSVLSAVAMAKEVWIMVVATVIAIAVMAIFAGPVARFVHEHPTIKMLALSFLVLIAVLLVADGLGTPIPKGYIYAAMAFSVAVEMLNSRAARKRRHDGAPPSRKAPPLVMPPANTPGRGGVLPEPERAAPSR